MDSHHSWWLCSTAVPGPWTFPGDTGCARDPLLMRARQEASVHPCFTCVPVMARPQAPRCVSMDKLTMGTGGLSEGAPPPQDGWACCGQLKTGKEGSHPCLTAELGGWSLPTFQQEQQTQLTLGARLPALLGLLPWAPRTPPPPLTSSSASITTGAHPFQ